MIRITIEGPQGSGKTIIARRIKRSIERMKMFGGRSYLTRIIENGGRGDSRDRDVYDIVIKVKQEKLK